MQAISKKVHLTALWRCLVKLKKYGEVVLNLVLPFQTFDF